MSALLANPFVLTCVVLIGLCVAILAVVLANAEPGPDGRQASEASAEEETAQETRPELPRRARHGRAR